MLSIRGASASTRAAAGIARELDRDVRKGIKRDVGRLIVEPMRAAAARRARRPVQRSLAATGRASWWRDIPGAAFGGARQVTSSGVSGKVIAHGTEYGSAGTRRATFAVRSPLGRAYSVTRRTSRQFMPRDEGGKMIAPAAEQVAPAVVEAWSTLVIDAAVVALDDLHPVGG